MVQILHREQILLQRCLLAPVDDILFEVVSPPGHSLRHRVVHEGLHVLLERDLGEAHTDVLVGGADLEEEERQACSINWMIGMIS